MSRARSYHLYHLLLATCLLLCTVWGCVEEEADDEVVLQDPAVLIDYPPAQALIEETITLELITDGDVDSVAVYKNGIFTGSCPADTMILHELRVFTDAASGDSALVRVEVYAADGRMAADSLLLFYRWHQSLLDGDEGYPANLKQIWVRSSSTRLDFRVETWEAWQNPYSADGIDCAIFIDSDANTATGFPADGEFLLPPNDIGADYIALVGLEGDSLFSWNAEQWTEPTAFAWQDIAADRDWLEFSLDLSALGNPGECHLVYGMITLDDELVYVDWAPDAISEHVSCAVDGLYVGGYDTETTASPRHAPASRRYSWRNSIQTR